MIMATLPPTLAYGWWLWFTRFGHDGTNALMYWQVSILLWPLIISVGCADLNMSFLGMNKGSMIISVLVFLKRLLVTTVHVQTFLACSYCKRPQMLSSPIRMLFTESFPCSWWLDCISLAMLLHDLASYPFGKANTILSCLCSIYVKAAVELQ